MTFNLEWDQERIRKWLIDNPQLSAIAGASISSSGMALGVIQSGTIITQDIVHTMLKPTAFYKETKMDQILTNISIIVPNINLWAGDKSLKPEDLAANGIDVSKLPPGKLAHLGSKKTINKDDLKEFVALKREAHAVCSRVGIKFGDSGYAIPNEVIPAVCAQLNDVKSRFAEAKAVFLSEYDTKIAEWIESNDLEWRDVIRKCIDPVSKVESVMSFNFSAFKIDPIGDVNGLDEEIGGLHGQLCKEVRTVAKNAIASSFVGRVSIGKRALRPASAILSKLEGLLFLDDSIQATVDELRAAISNVEDDINHSPEKECAGKTLNELIGVMTKLANMGNKTVYEEAAPLYEEELVEETAAAPAAPQTKLNWDF